MRHFPAAGVRNCQSAPFVAGRVGRFQSVAKLHHSVDHVLILDHSHDAPIERPESINSTRWAPNPFMGKDRISSIDCNARPSFYCFLAPLELLFEEWPRGVNGLSAGELIQTG